MRKICVYTSTRAEYGLLRALMIRIRQSPVLNLKLLVSGTHLISDQGMTLEEIIKDGFEPDTCVDIDLTDDSPTGICRSMGVAVSEYGKFFACYSPDVLVILGDRFEAFCCAAAAQVCRIPIAHIHGGETTQGAVDEAFRHSITKMAHLHFPSCEEYRQRIIQMGEQPDKVYNVGALGVENIRTQKLMTCNDLEKSIGFKLDAPFFLVTFHPVTLENDSYKKQFAQILAALDQFSDHKVIFTGANADTGGGVINQMQIDYGKKNPGRCFVIPSLGYLRYLSAMKICQAVVGNSSSGLIEAPALKVPTVNIGNRQKGRIRIKTVVDCDPDKNSIVAAIKKTTENSFRADLENHSIPFEKPGTSKLIKRILETADLKGILQKEFFNIDF